MPTINAYIFHIVTAFVRNLAGIFAEISATECRIFNNTITVAGIGLAIFAASPAIAAPATTDTRVVTDYQLAVVLHPDEQNLSATASLLLTGSERTSVLKLSPRAEIEAVTVGDHPVPYRFADGRLALDLPAPSTRATPTRLTIRYRARFADPPPAETVGIEDPSFGISATILPEGSYLSAGIPWFPQLAGTRGRHRVEVTAPAGVVAVTAGRLLEVTTRNGRTVSIWENDFPLEGLALAAGRFEIARDQLDGIQLLTFLSRDNADLADSYLAAMRRHLVLYRELLGPYPFSKFAVVENFLPTGYGLPSWTLLGKSVVRLPFILDTSLPHEIVHAWWGNAVEVDYAGGNWAEGLTTYLADYLLKERSSPQEARAYRLNLLRDYAALVTPERDISLDRFTGRTAKYQQAIGYGKGALTFHMLRREIGDQAFWQGLRRMAAEGQGRTLGWRDIEAIFSGIAGRDLRWFFAQWVERRGAPSLALDELRTVPSAAGWIVSGVVRQSGGDYRLTLPLVVTTQGGDSIRQTLAVAGSRTPFRFSVNSLPTQLEADPDSDNFRRLDPIELPATINDLRMPRRPLVIVAAGHDGLRAAARDLLKGLGWDESEVVAEEQLDQRQRAGRDLLLLGWPQRPDLQPALPDDVTMTPTTFSWRDHHGDTLFAVFRRGGSEPATTALLLAATPEAARAAAAKVPHYGRYSMLLFTGGRNTARTTWVPERSPLKVVLAKESLP